MDSSDKNKIFGESLRKKFSNYEGLTTVFFSGITSIILQCLLLREFVSSLEGNDITISVFFSFWMLFCGLFSFLTGKIGLSKKLSSFSTFLPLFFIPAFIIQLILLNFVKQFFGASQYEALPIYILLASATIVNLPVPALVGIIFPCACQKASQSGLSLAFVYVSELAGSLTGGVLASFLLFTGHSLPFVFLLILAIIFIGVWLANLAKKISVAWICLSLTALFALILRADSKLDNMICRFKWAKILPADSYSGVFRTPYGEYLYGQYGDRTNVFKDGAIFDIFPDKEAARSKAAIALSQNPDAQNILVVGGGIELCRAFLKASTVKTVYFCGFDPDYHKNLSMLFPEAKISDSRFCEIKSDIRKFLTDQNLSFDLVFLDISPSASAFANRFSSLEFYSLISNKLSAEGILISAIRSGENALSPQNIFEGASAFKTLSLFFPNIIFIPGDHAWFIASKTRELQKYGETARVNFLRIKGAEDIYPPDYLAALYRPFFGEKALAEFASAAATREIPFNSDGRPVSFLNGLLIALRQSGINIYPFFRKVITLGTAVFVVPLLALAFIFFISKFFWRSSFSGNILFSVLFVMLSGIPGMGTSVLLMYAFQCQHGILLSSSGALTAFFMLGMTIGSLFFASIIRKGFIRIEALIMPVLFFSCSLIMLSALMAYINMPVFVFLLVLAVNGFMNGAYFPIASNMICDSQNRIGEYAGLLAFADYTGAALASLFSGMALIPLLGADGAIAVFSFCICIFMAIMFKSEHLKAFYELNFKFRRIKLSFAFIMLIIWLVVSTTVITIMAKNLFYSSVMESKVKSFVPSNKMLLSPHKIEFMETEF